MENEKCPMKGRMSQCKEGECHHQPIEEKWKKEISEGAMAQVYCRINDRELEILESFIENLLEQERRRMSDEVKKLGYSVGELDKYVKGDVKDTYHDGFMTAKDKVKAIINK